MNINWIQSPALIFFLSAAALLPGRAQTPTDPACKTGEESYQDGRSGRAGKHDALNDGSHEPGNVGALLPHSHGGDAGGFRRNLDSQKQRASLQFPLPYRHRIGFSGS